MDEIVLTKKEQKAIERLHRLAKTWPQSLSLFSATGSLLVLKFPKDTREGEGILQYEVAEIIGIPNDGGDPDQ